MTDWDRDRAVSDEKERERIGLDAVEAFRKVIAGPAPELTPDADERERWVHQMVRYRTFGTLEQVRATADRVRGMLSVELHQDVVTEQLHQAGGSGEIPVPIYPPVLGDGGS